MEAKLPINEIFGPTIQGEGPDIGRGCVFVRVHACPVQCPGCDTSYTWNGSERGGLMTALEIHTQVQACMYGNANGCGIVLSGGEPLIYYDNPAMTEWLRYPAKWRSIETSGYFGREIKDPERMELFFESFDTFCISPKITPCLHGRQSDGELTRLIPLFRAMQMRRKSPGTLVLKFVVRDEADVAVVVAYEHNSPSSNAAPIPIYLMPYGNDRDEILKTIERIAPFAQRYGYIISPRLHSILWGPTRGV